MLSAARRVTTSFPDVRKRFAGIHFFVNDWHESVWTTEKRCVAARARALLSRAVIATLPGLSSQTLKRMYTRFPSHFRERKRSDGALLPCTVVVEVVVVDLPPATTAERLDAVVETPEAVRAGYECTEPMTGIRAPHAIRATRGTRNVAAILA